MKRLANKPFITYLLLGINVIVFIIWCYFVYRLEHQDFLSKEMSEAVAGLLLGAENPMLIWQGHQYWRFFTAMFVHFGVMHILCNGVFLYAIGQTTENVLGHWRYLLLYLLSGLGGNVLPMVIQRDNAAVAGASGALFGLLGFWTVIWLMYCHQPNGILNAYGKEMFTLAVANIVLNLLMSGVSISGHIGGFLSGMIVGFILLKWFKPRQISMMAER